MKLAFTLFAFVFAVIGANAQDPQCQTGIPGPFGLVAACCPATCGTCGGAGCGNRPGGATDCCGGNINRQPNNSCDVRNPPCIIQRDPDCETGVLNTDLNLCCPRACGPGADTCGGRRRDSQCARRIDPAVIGFSVQDTNAVSRDICCQGRIRRSGRRCATSPPPCVP